MQRASVMGIKACLPSSCCPVQAIQGDPGATCKQYCPYSKPCGKQAEVAGSWSAPPTHSPAPPPPTHTRTPPLPPPSSKGLCTTCRDTPLHPPPRHPHAVMMDPLRNRASPTDEYEVSGAPPKQRRLTYGDVQGFRQVMEAIVTSNDTYQMHSPEAPVLESSHWLEAHFKEVCGVVRVA